MDSGRDGGIELPVFVGINRDEFAADGADDHAVEVDLVVAVTEADDGPRVAGVHETDFLAFGDAFVAGAFFGTGRVHDGPVARLVCGRRGGLACRCRTTLLCKLPLYEFKIFQRIQFHARKGTHLSDGMPKIPYICKLNASICRRKGIS